jgi:phytanoyl-CoA hydroxylase
MSITNQIFNFYKREGYCVIRNLINVDDVDDFIKALKRDLYQNNEIEYPKMDNQEFGRVSLSKFGYLKNPIADIHLIKYINSELSLVWESALKILINRKLIEVVNTLTSASSQALVMSMFFDQNAGTPLHQDCYYLDTLPPRNLTAAFIALEDINEAAGRFCVIPKSQEIFLELSSEELKNSNKYEDRIADLITKNKLKPTAPALKKGDVLFWNSGTIHGSLRTKDESFSRKSLTCHFVPNHCDYVQNQYIPTIRPIEGFFHNEILCRITNSIKKERVNTDLVSRTADRFLR